MKKILIVLVVLLLIASALLGTIIILERRDGREEYSNKNGADQVEYSGQIEQVTSYRSYVAAQNYIDKYLKKIYYANNPELVENESDPETNEETRQAIIDMLYTPYIQENNINTTNVLDYVYEVDENYSINMLDMREIIDERIQTYYIYGTISDNQSIYLVLYIDEYNATFSIQPLKEQYNNIDEINVRKTIDEITSTYNNQTMYSEVTPQSICTSYLMKYKQNLINNPEQAYNLLDENYRNARFATFENFQEYLEDSAEIIDKITLESYSVNNNNDYTEYICEDVYGNYYIFHATSVFDYTVQLDTYTLSDEIEKTYSEASNDKKAGLGIELFFEMINARDYRHAYEKLDETFKNENFPTYQQFKEYVKTNFYTSNSINYVTNRTIENLYTYNIIITDSNNEESESISKTFIVQLQEGTDYVLSFNVS